MYQATLNHFLYGRAGYTGSLLKCLHVYLEPVIRVYRIVNLRFKKLCSLFIQDTL